MPLISYTSGPALLSWSPRSDSADVVQFYFSPSHGQAVENMLCGAHKAITPAMVLAKKVSLIPGDEIRMRS